MLGLIVIAVVALLVALAVRVDAAPAFDAEDEQDAIVAFGGDANDADAPDRARPAPPPPELSPIAPPVPVSAVVAAAVRAAGLAHDPTPSWRMRARLAGLVPMVSVRAGRNETWRDVTDPTLGYVDVFDVGATWHLERLEFDPNEIRIAAMDISRRREKRKVGERAIRAYYEWLALEAAGPAWTARAAEVTAELDAMTDGWFSETLGKHLEPR